MASVRRPQFLIRLNWSVRADLQWWHCFLQSWNGSSFFPPPTPSTNIYSDASGSFGCGAIDFAIGWFQLQWPDRWLEVNIATQELLPVVVAAAMWGDSWWGCHVCFHSDNMAVVAVINKHSSKDASMVNLLRCLFFYSAFYKFHYSAVHIAGSINTTADMLSRLSPNNLSFVPPVCSLPSHCQSAVVADTGLDLGGLDQVVSSLFAQGLAPVQLQHTDQA